jgi:hypothetical protein
VSVQDHFGVRQGIAALVFLVFHFGVRQGIAALVFLVFVPSVPKRKYQSANPLPHSKTRQPRAATATAVRLPRPAIGIAFATNAFHALCSTS